MKKLSILLMAFVAFVGLNSCSSDDDVVFIAQPDVEGINFTNSFNESYILTPATSGNIAERFVWNTVDFDVPTNITYQLQGANSEDFSSFDIIGATGENNLGVKVSQLKSLADDAGLDNDANTDAPNTGLVYFRVRAFAGTDGGNGLSEMSAVKSITLILPEGETEEVLINYFMVGDATAAVWDNNKNNTPLFRDGVNVNAYYFTGRFKGAADAEGFKLLTELGNWDSQWGLDGDKLSSKEILGEDPKAFPVSTDAYYSFSINIDEMTWSFEPFDASAAKTYAKIGLVGDGTTAGWPGDDNVDPDILMTKSTFDAHIWFAQGVELSEGGVKFRANLLWDTSWGGGESFPSGIATGDNITAKEGTYNVWFNDLTGRYIFLAVE
jgi:hypothetical protein